MLDLYPGSLCYNNKQKNNAIDMRFACQVTEMWTDNQTSIIFYIMNRNMKGLEHANPRYRRYALHLIITKYPASRYIYYLSTIEH